MTGTPFARAAVVASFAIGAWAATACSTAAAPAGASPAPRPASSTVPSLAPAPATSSETADTRLRTEPRAERRVARMLKHVEAARGLPATKTVPGVLLDRPALIARVKEHVLRELPAQAIRNEGLELQLFGFLPTDFDYEAAEYRLLQDQLAGYYEPADGTMYMANDLGDEEADATLAHELVHALQDQHWDLATRSKYRPGAGDASSAVSALAEGDATSAMFDVTIARSTAGRGRTALDIPDELFAEQISEGMKQGPGATAPHIMRSSLAAPYIYGTLFVHALRRRGGWDAVNRAWDDAPTTTEQILHVDKWLAREPPLQIAAPTFDALGAGWRSVDEDSEGELGARLAFEEWLPPRAAADASAGWGGDRQVQLENGDRSAFAWKLAYDAPSSPSDADRAAAAYAALTRALDKLLGAPKAKDDAFSCHERVALGPLAVRRIKNGLVFSMGPARVATGAWASAGDCALASKWTREIAGSH